MPAETERYRFVPWEIEDVDGIPRLLPGGYADVTRGGGMKYDQVVFLGPGGAAGAEFHLKRGHVRKLEQFGFASRADEARRGRRGRQSRPGRPKGDREARQQTVSR